MAIRMRSGLWRPGKIQLRHRIARAHERSEKRTYVGRQSRVTGKAGVPFGTMTWTVRVEVDGQPGDLQLAKQHRAYQRIGGKPVYEFAWGRLNAATLQTAWAILSDAVGTTRARPLFETFANEVLVPRKWGKGWRLSIGEVIGWVEAHEGAGNG